MGDEHESTAGIHRVDSSEACGSEQSGKALHGGPETRPGAERRRPRFPVDNPVFVVPVLPDGRPDRRHLAMGACRDISLEGMGLAFDVPENHIPAALVVGVQEPNGSTRYEGVEVRHLHRPRSNHFQLGGSFGGPGHELLRSESLEPTFHQQSLDFGFGVPEKVLQAWAEIDILQPVWLDRVELCPQCHRLPTIRPGCPNCGSARVINERLIHHFTCAHVGRVSDFETADGLVCPKCRARRLIVNSDYEYMTGPFQCQSCQWSCLELEQVAQCLGCGLRFPGYQAYVQELRGYHVNRLDPLALVPQS